MAKKKITTKASEAGRLLRSLRTTTTAGRKRSVQHSDEGYCRCIDCRRKRGHYPNRPKKR